MFPKKQELAAKDEIPSIQSDYTYEMTLYKILTNQIYWHLMTKLPNTLYRIKYYLNSYHYHNCNLTNPKDSEKYNVFAF